MGRKWWVVEMGTKKRLHEKVLSWEHKIRAGYFPDRA